MTGCCREPHLHVFADRAMWRWSYHDPGGEQRRELVLRSSIAFTDAGEARSSATTAYPETPVADDEAGDDDDSEQQSTTKHQCRRAVPAAVAVAFLIGAVLIIRRRQTGSEPTRARLALPSLARSRERSGQSRYGGSRRV